MDNRIGPIEASPSMTGEQYQQAFRGLKGYRAENVKPGFEQDYRDALTSGMDALTGVIKRGGGQDVVMNLNDADPPTGRKDDTESRASCEEWLWQWRNSGFHPGPA